MKIKEGYSNVLKNLFAYTESLEEFEARITPEQYARDNVAYEGDEVEKLVSFLKTQKAKKDCSKKKKFLLETLQQKDLENNPLELKRLAFMHLNYVGEMNLRVYLTESGMGAILHHLEKVENSRMKTMTFLRDLTKYQEENSFVSFKE